MTHELPPAAPPSARIDEREAALVEFRELAALRHQLALRGARAVLELKRTGAHFFAGASSVAHFAEMNGMAAWEARELENLGHAIENDATLAKEVESGTIPVASAAILGEVVMSSELMRGDDDWYALALTKSTRELRRLFLRRRDEARAGEPVTPVTAYVTRAVFEDLGRARELTSRRAHVALTIGQTLGIVVDDWLEERDPLRKTPGARRLPDTSGIPGDRYVPVEVDREVRARSDDRCIVPFCDGVFWVQRSHRLAHRDGGSREADNLDLFCDSHHLLYELGAIVVTGPPDTPTVTSRDGRPLDARYGFLAPEPMRPNEHAPPAPPSDAQSPIPRADIDGASPPSPLASVDEIVPPWNGEPPDSPGATPGPPHDEVGELDLEAIFSRY